MSKMITLRGWIIKKVNWSCHLSMMYWTEHVPHYNLILVLVCEIHLSQWYVGWPTRAHFFELTECPPKFQERETSDVWQTLHQFYNLSSGSALVGKREPIYHAQRPKQTGCWTGSGKMLFISVARTFSRFSKQCMSVSRHFCDQAEQIGQSITRWVKRNPIKHFRRGQQWKHLLAWDEPRPMKWWRFLLPVKVGR